jgi:RNA 3'-terminal phosphate cyclase (ATP)
MNDPVTIDGRLGEGGGQVLRSSLALSLACGRPIHIEKIRARRRKSGLMRQHLACVRAAIEISGAGATGVQLGSEELRFAPGVVRAGDYAFSVGSAGSAALVLQTVLLPLALTGQPSRVRIEGGTHNAWAPPYDFLQYSFLPLLRRMGIAVELELERVGFYPAGGGVLVARIQPLADPQPLSLLERGDEGRPHVLIRRAHLPAAIADREWEALRRVLFWEYAQRRDLDHPESAGPGNSMHAVLEFEHVTEVVSSFGAKQRSAKQVAAEAAKGARHYLSSKAPVGRYLADQLLLPMALLAGGEFRTLALTSHTETNIDVIHSFLPERIQVSEVEAQTWLVRVKGD